MSRLTIMLTTEVKDKPEADRIIKAFEAAMLTDTSLKIMGMSGAFASYQEDIPLETLGLFATSTDKK